MLRIRITHPLFWKKAGQKTLILEMVWYEGIGYQLWFFFFEVSAFEYGG